MGPSWGPRGALDRKGTWESLALKVSLVLLALRDPGANKGSFHECPKERGGVFEVFDDVKLLYSFVSF